MKLTPTELEKWKNNNSYSQNSDKATMADSGRSKTEELDKALDAVGFELDVVSSSLVSGHLLITDKCSQPFGVLHGGVSALISESLASMGAHMASGFKRVDGVQLSINHLKPAKIGDNVVAEARPVTAGRTVQVWQVEIWKLGKEVKIASSRVSLLVNMSVPENAMDADMNPRKHAKL